jgi:hypothetical protein
MADTPPNVPGATGPEPMKKTTGKVAPKKETVRITLPPKPSAAPTIKLPTLPPGGPTGAPTAATSPAAPRIATPPPAAARAAAPAAGPRAAAAPAAQRAAAPRAVAAAAPTVSTFDKVLAIAAGVAGLAAIGGSLWIFLTLKNTVESFSS